MSVYLKSPKPEQLAANLDPVEVTFTPDELRQLDEVSKLPAEYPGWMIGYTSSDRVA